MQFLKYHALGNDYLVLRNELFGEQTPDWAVKPDLDAVIRLSLIHISEPTRPY